MGTRRSIGPVLAWADEVVAAFGAVHMIWNVAGVIAAGDVLHGPRADLERLLAVDFWGVVNGTTAFLPHVVTAGGGHEVNVSSAFGLISAAGPASSSDRTPAWPICWPG
jgi:NAD(P)-dependent dehydrogenase (short-subunit alcohol dehydrogenase family)